jgi:hypothetical protein
MNAAMVCKLLSKTVVFKWAYVEMVSEEKVRNVFVLIYELLHGPCFVTEVDTVFVAGHGPYQL